MAFDPHPTEDTEYTADEDRIVELHDVEGWDRNGVVDAAGHVHSDADPGL